MSSNQVQDQYKKLSQIEHVLTRPDTYVGSIEAEEVEMWLIDANEEGNQRISKQLVRYVPALYKCFDEILVNAIDHWKRLKTKKENEVKYQVSQIKVSVDVVSGEITVTNDGDGIDAVHLKEHNCTPVELIFGHLLTSTNYDDTEERDWGGRNGYGAKLANIFSKQFTVESVDATRQKKVTMTWKNNMSEKTKAIIKSCQSKPYTTIKWLPDYERFGGNMMGTGQIDKTFMSIIQRRTFDASACTDAKVTVFWQGERINVKSFKDYVNLYIGPDSKVSPRVHTIMTDSRKTNRQWEVVVAGSQDDSFEQISFVNGISTLRGGKHVDVASDMIVDNLVEAIKKSKKLTVKKPIAKAGLWIFLNSTIVNPAFDSQTKEYCKTPKSKMGVSPQLDEKIGEKLVKTDIVKRIISHAAFKDKRELEKTDGKRSSRVIVPKLDDAIWAGSKRSKQCTLILTEGDSAKALAISGLSVVGRERYGVFPLRGKILNVKDESPQKINSNAEITAIKKILGLKAGEVYKNDSDVWPLRYGKIMIMTDQDHDGFHIKGLLMNLFQCMWPSLLDIGFICSMVTPIVKAKRGFGKRMEVKQFYTLTDYENWWNSLGNNTKGWTIKYYKGLGTSDKKEAKEYFTDLRVISYVHQTCDDEQMGAEQACSISHDSLDLAFNSKRADDRKQWLGNYDKKAVLDYNLSQATFKSYIDKELIHFSNSDNERSIPHLMDGLKVSQRKILFACLKRNLIKEIKVSQLSGYVSEQAAYHHAEMSLQSAITNMAQNFPGSNNLNLLEPRGQFGTRLLGGKDASSPRYIFTCLSPLALKLYHSVDASLVPQQTDDGIPIEPEFYAPIIPMILVNGADGIGTGYSCQVPQHHPIEVMKTLMNRLEGKQTKRLRPWVREWTGEFIHRKVAVSGVEPEDDLEYYKTGFQSEGKYEILDLKKGKIKITELPVGIWTSKYKDWLESLMVDRGPPTTKQWIKDVESYSSEDTIEFHVTIDPKHLSELRAKPDRKGGILQKFNLISNNGGRYSNMWLHTPNGILEKFNTPTEIIDKFIEFRKPIYVSRREKMINILKQKKMMIDAQVRFIEAMLNDELDVRRKKRQVIVQELEQANYPKLGESKNYDYLLKMHFWNLTEEDVEELRKKAKDVHMQMEELEGKTAVQLWKDDLKQMETVWKVQERVMIEQMNLEQPKKRRPVIKKKRVSKKQ